jgi:hypothetical protein
MDQSSSGKWADGTHFPDVNTEALGNKVFIQSQSQGAAKPRFNPGLSNSILHPCHAPH